MDCVKTFMIISSWCNADGGDDEMMIKLIKMDIWYRYIHRILHFWTDNMLGSLPTYYRSNRTKLHCAQITSHFWAILQFDSCNKKYSDTMGKRLALLVSVVVTWWLVSICMIIMQGAWVKILQYKATHFRGLQLVQVLQIRLAFKW